MLAAQHKEMVIETIDLLRQRKARPDFVRICRMVERKHGLTATETRTSLEALENEETVMKVHFKGNISYRHVKNFTVPRPPDAKVFDTSTRITQSLGQITKETGDGASFHDLEQWLVFKNPETRLVKNRLEAALQKEIDNGTVTRLSDDCFVLTESMPKKATIVKVDGPVKPPMKSPESKHGNVEESNGKGRPVSKRKKIRKEPISDSDAVFTPDEGKNGLPACDFCSLSAEYNLQGKPEALLTCKDCQAKAHPSCMAYSTTLASRARTSPWQCMDCKTCYVCDDSGNPDCMLFCDACDKGYHMSCHNPPLTAKPKGKWVCSRCKLDVKGVAGEKNGLIHTQKGVSGGSQSEKVSEDSNEDDEGLGVTRRGRKRKLPAKLRSSPSLPLKRTKSQQSSISSVPAATPTHDLPAKSSGQDRYLHENYIDVMAGSGGSTGSSTAGDTFDYEMKMACNGVVFNAPDDRKYPDATDWDMDEVVKFFQECGFKDQAKAFKEQEIDGRSLLLMKRSDVLSGLTLKLGPALKIYQKIVKLQTVRTES